MFCFADATGSVPSGLLRPGNAGANTVADHVKVLDDAIAQVPEKIAAGHHDGDDPEPSGPHSLPNHRLRGSGNPIHDLRPVSRLLVNGAG
jgi:hypothetical protein